MFSFPNMLFCPDMWPLRTALLLVCCSGYWSFECNMTKARFESRNFYTVLHWDAVHIPDQEVRYCVLYIKYGNLLKPVTGCQNISDHFCDLTSVMTDVRSRYYTKIMVNEMCGQYVEFTPFEQTILGAPLVSKSVSGSSLTVRATAPMGPHNRSVDKISCWEKCQGSAAAPVNYVVHLTRPESEALRPFENKSGTVTLQHLEPGTEYCGTVLYWLTHPAAERQSEVATFCVTVPGKRWMQVFFVTGLVALFLLVTTALVLCQIYVTRKNQVPKVLIMSKSITGAYYPDPEVEIAAVTICSEVIRNAGKYEPHSPPVLHKAVRNDSVYTSHNRHDQPWHCRSYTSHQVPPVGTCDQNAESSVSYSILVSVPVSGPEEPSQLEKGGHEEDSIMSETPGPRSAREDSDSSRVLSDPQADRAIRTPEPGCDLLVLPVLRGTNGTLKFSSISFQPELSSDLVHSTENIPPKTGFTPADEKCPLLTSLVTTDQSEWPSSELGLNYRRVYFPNGAPQSRELALNYRRAYLPNGAPHSCTVFPSAETVPLASLSDSISNYRQNWVPGIFPETQRSSRACTARAAQLHALSELVEEEEDEEEDETQSHFGSITLGGWMVQIQG
ncbi:interferon lambda receptor 1 isoform X2 [Brachyhypopomus gauderio]|uniref:interferon lambda receptor 1 isoform X2 n=1 Tax=Brachyhypopomus gauderio TaxID=698409 RepID=UPI004042E359